MCDHRVADDLAQLCRAMSDPTRVKIMLEISRGEMSVGDVARAVGASDSVTSHHLRVLRNCALVARRRAGKTVYYRLDDEHVHQMIAAGLAHVTEPRHEH